jgi:hypothetical protein
MALFKDNEKSTLVKLYENIHVVKPHQMTVEKHRCWGRFSGHLFFWLLRG